MAKRSKPSRPLFRAFGIEARIASIAGSRPTGTLPVGSMAIGACAVGALGIGRLAIRRAAIQYLRIEELDAGRPRVGSLEVVSEQRPQAPPAAS